MKRYRPMNHTHHDLLVKLANAATWSPELDDLMDWASQHAYAERVQLFVKTATGYLVGDTNNPTHIAGRPALKTLHTLVVYAGHEYDVTKLDGGSPSRNAIRQRINAAAEELGKVAPVLGAVLRNGEVIKLRTHEGCVWGVYHQLAKSPCIETRQPYADLTQRDSDQSRDHTANIKTEIEDTTP